MTNQNKLVFKFSFYVHNLNHVSNLKYKDLEWVIDGAACDDQHENGGNKAANGNECFVP